MTELEQQIRAYLHEKRRRSQPTLLQYRYILMDVFLPWATAEGIT